MKDLEGLHHHTRTPARLHNVPITTTSQWLQEEFARQGFPPNRFNFFFLPGKPGYYPGILFFDFFHYGDIPEFCQTGFQLQPEYTRNQGKAALIAHFETTPLEYDPLNLED